MKERLDEIDSLLVAELNDSAYQLIQLIDENIISKPEDKAHYYLLQTKINYLVTNALKNDSLVDFAISYYCHNKDLLLNI